MELQKGRNLDYAVCRYSPNPKPKGPAPAPISWTLRWS